MKNVQARPIQDVLKATNFANILYAWAQAVPDGYTVVKDWLATPVQNNETFLDVLIGLRGWTNSSNRGVYYPLKRENVELFFNHDEAFERALKLQQSSDKEIAKKSRLVIQAFNDAKDD